MGKKVFRLAAVYLVAAVFLTWGFAIGAYQVFPYRLLQPVISDIHHFLFPSDVMEKSLRDKIVLPPQVITPPIPLIGFNKVDLEFTDPGYLLMSYYNDEHKKVVADLIKIDGFDRVYRWVPPTEEILKRTPERFKWRFENQSPSRYAIKHPYLMNDGSLIFHSGEGPLVRMDRCGNIVWMIQEFFHHAIEADHQGHLWIPMHIQPNTFKEIDYEEYRDEGFAKVSTDGKILKTYSLSQILYDNNELALLFGIRVISSDSLHLNDAQPMKQSIGMTQIGDIGLSIRHLSTVLLYRPSTNKIVWLRTGPWLNQHDINLLPDGRFSIFDNRMARVFNTKKNKIDRATFFPSDVVIYDAEKDSWETPFHMMMEKNEIYTYSEGRSEILDNGDVFIDSFRQARLIRLHPKGVRWDFVNSTDGKRASLIHWTRYYKPNDLDLAFVKKSCPSNTGP